MRRVVPMGPIVALVVVLAAGGGARAHVCTNPVRLEPDRVGVVTVGVPAEQARVTEVVVHLPKDFRLRSASTPPRWTRSSSDSRDLHYTGGPIRPFECAYFSLAGTAPDKGVLVFPLTVRSEDGAAQKYTGRKPTDRYPAQLVYVGVEPPVPGIDEGGNSSVGTAVGAGLILTGLAAGGLMWRRSRASAPRRRRGRRPAR